MSIDWASIAGWSGTVLTIVVFGGRQIYLKGVNDRRMKDMGVEVTKLGVRVDSHDEKLQDSSVNFATIIAKLDNLSDGQKELKDAFTRHTERRD